MTTCVFRYCKNTSRNNKDSSCISFHRFAHPGHPKRDEWIRIVQKDRSEDSWLPTKYSFICSAHFQASDLYTTKTGKRFLKKSAIPAKNPLPAPTPKIIMPNYKSLLYPPRIIKLEEDSSKVPAAKKESSKKNIRLQRENECLKKKTKKLTSIMKQLKEKFGIDKQIKNQLFKQAKVVEIYCNTLQKKRKSRKKSQYAPSIRKFALTCNYYSPAAYKYVHKFFQNALPHPRALSKWYGSINAEPGFTNECFKNLELKFYSSSKPVVCSLVFGEMTLRKQKLFKEKKLGYVNFGDCPIEGQEEAVATQVLVFMLVSLSENWKIPLGYFLAAGISADTKASLIRICLIKCSEVGVFVPSVTFDGCPANFQAVEKLGCNFADVDNLKTYFIHPSTLDKVYVLVDPCHIIKLIRNTFENKKILYDEDGQLIKWQLLVNLTRLQQSRRLNFANKVTPRYIDFRNQVLKAKLATQLLSKSVANALILYDKELKFSQFRNSVGTVKFITTMNYLFDVLNSRSCHFYGYKRPLDSNNSQEIFDFLDNVKTYIGRLRFRLKKRRQIRMPNREPRVLINISEKRIVESKNNTGFVGALICIQSLKGLYTMLVEKSVIKYLSTYRLSQDHLHLFFGCIRRNSNNNNPNALQYRAGYKKALNHLELRSSFTENCIPLDNFTISNSSSVDVINDTAIMNRHDEEFQIVENERTLDSDRLAETNCIILADRLNTEQLTTVRKLIVGYLSGYVSRKLNKELKCEECVSSLVTSVRIWHHKLIHLKDMGGLCYSTEDVYKICLKTETIIRHLIKYKGHGKNCPRTFRNKKTIVSNTLKTFINSDIFDSLYLHSLQQPATLNHRTHLIRAVIEEYAKIRLHHKATTDLQIHCSTKRQKLTKLILFEGKSDIHYVAAPSDFTRVMMKNGDIEKMLPIFNLRNKLCAV
ncbi:hypothetical protein O3G_MSEX002641 [Manduca sexta]|uniref:THAP-type domain-containing protein n=1 Tax=Manduca sexta TaxID=7130 RepID=A0A921YQS5_MANSE|nr:hypothetical protein O3G_MSEX002641 [Manduca sexta]